MTPEFSRRFALAAIGTAELSVTLTADAAECTAVAKRFDLVRLDSLTATAVLVARGGGVDAHGRMAARVMQACVVTGDPVAAVVEQAFTLRFVDQAAFDAAATTEVELSDNDCDILAHDGETIDLGEAVAQTMGLALDPFPRSAIDAGLNWQAGPDSGAFAGLKTLLGGGERS